MAGWRRGRWGRAGGKPIVCRVLAVVRCLLLIDVNVSSVAAFPFTITASYLVVTSQLHPALLIYRLNAMELCSVPPPPSPSDDLKPISSCRLCGVAVG